MDKTVETIRELRGMASRALSDFRKQIDETITLAHVDSGMEYSHDNLRVVTGEDSPFSLDQAKYQVLVVMVGHWMMKHGKNVRELVPTDVAKVPMGAPVPTIMETDEPNAKFVYVQFENDDRG
jgi:hypothetical protein